LKVVSGKEFCKVLRKQGWYLDRIKGSHHSYKHPNSNKRIVVPVHGNQDLKKGLQRSLMKQTGIKEDML
jgi:predicted RNA binding protein YcfA (HicA-like mRNA interferase family)